MKLLPTTSLLAITAFTTAQNCYFPNGDVTPDSYPCFPASDASACCPQNWECFSNGLCYLDNEQFWGRYSCTDRLWEDDACPQYCTQNGTAPGNEAILQCDDGHWCCDGNRATPCCDDPSKDVDIEDGSSLTMVTNLPHTSSVPPLTRSPEVPPSPSPSTTTTSSSPSTSSPSPSSSPTPVTPPPKPTTITTQAATTNSQGIATTIILISTETASQSAPTTNKTNSEPVQKSQNNTPLIAGVATAVPIALILAALGLYLFFRRRRNLNDEPKPSTSTTDSSDLKYMYNNATPDGRPPEIDSYPVAAGTKPGHMSQVSELSGSEPRSPTIPSLSSLYSPQTKSGPGFGGGGGGLGQVEEEEPVELSAGEDAVAQTKTKDFANRTSYPGYVPYRPGDGVESQEDEAPQSQPKAQYVAYRPSGEGEGQSLAAEAPVSPAQSPRSDFDHGQVGVGGLRIANQ